VSCSSINYNKITKNPELERTGLLWNGGGADPKKPTTPIHVTLPNLVVLRQRVYGNPKTGEHWGSAPGDGDMVDP